MKVCRYPEFNRANLVRSMLRKAGVCACCMLVCGSVSVYVRAGVWEEGIHPH